MEMQGIELEYAAMILTDTLHARDRLTAKIPDMSKGIFIEFVLPTEQFWWSVLQCEYLRTVKMLRKKARLFVKEGALLTGLPDPTDYLGDNEIFLSVRPVGSDDSREIIGRVLIYRNPCAYPGDLCVVNAVSMPADFPDHLRKTFENTVVLSVRGSPIAHNCSGGDLDGDMFSVIWDQHLVPPDDVQYPPLDYDALLATAKKKLNGMKSGDTSSIEDVFMRVMEDNSLGKISICHLALCDLLPNGALEPLAIELAKAKSFAVDYPKTGIACEVPGEALKKVTMYPDFMEKTGEFSYSSKKPLGALYRQLLSYPDDISDLGPLQQIDYILVIPSHEKFLPWANLVYARYSSELQIILAQFGLRREAEFILGEPATSWHSYMPGDRGKASLAVQQSFRLFSTKFRSIFCDAFQNRDDMLSAASACYVVAYSIGNKKSYKSFPWVICGDTICALKKQSSDQSPPDFYTLLGRESLSFFLKGVKLTLNSVIRLNRVAENIKCHIERLHPDAISIHVFGSAGMFLCEPDSDLDLFVNVIDGYQLSDKTEQSEHARMNHYMDTLITPMMDSIMDSKRSECTSIGRILRCEMETDNGLTSIDICMQEDGHLKAKYVLSLYSSFPWVYPLFWLVFNWARASGLIKSKCVSSSNNFDGILTTSALHALIISILNLFPAKEGNDSLTLMSAISSANKLGKGNGLQLGELGSEIFNFFRRGSELSSQGPFEFTWPIGLQVIELSAAVIYEFSQGCKRALHCLSLTRSWSFLLTNIAADDLNGSRFFRRLPKSLTHYLSPALEFQMARLQRISGCKTVLIEPCKEGSGLSISAQGSRSAIQKLKDELSVLSKSSTLGFRRERTSRYFMENSVLMACRRSIDNSSQLEFNQHCDRIQLLHRRHETHVPILYSLPVDTWEDFFVRSFADKVLQQMLKFPNDTTNIANTLHFRINFGIFYLVNIRAALVDRETISLR
jgi:hypothetical protein